MTQGHSKIAVVSVHGTGDTAAEPDGAAGGDKWFQTRSAFMGRLKERLAGSGVEADFFAHLWTGANSASEREHGARALAKTVKKLAKKYDGRVHVIGHSHGGNVANDAAVMLNWSKVRPRQKVASIVTVGTPFFRSHATASDQLGAWIFAAVLMVSVLMIPTIAIFAGDSVTSAILDAINMPFKSILIHEVRPEAIDDKANDVGALLVWLGANALPLASGIALLFMLPLAFRGLGRIRRASVRMREDTPLYSLWHPNDEAIAFLSRLEGVPIEPFPRWSLFRSSRTGGILWGVRLIVLINLVGILFWRLI
jgi:pimeloyl-ACP methyl ester carboxylesterase